MTHDELIDLLRQYVKAAGTQREFAEKIGVAQATVATVLSGQYLPGPALLDAIGMRKVVTYESITKQPIAPPPLGYCDCGRPATRRVRLKVNRKEHEFVMCVRCAALEVSE